MFTTPCYIRKNTHELRARLQELGYEYVEYGLQDEVRPKSETRKYIVTYPHGKYTTSNHKQGHPDFFDCGTNEALFLALAALRDDTDIGQWFYVDRENAVEEFVRDWRLCRDDKFNINTVPAYGWYLYHKATPAELVEYFNNTRP